MPVGRGIDCISRPDGKIIWYVKKDPTFIRSDPKFNSRECGPIDPDCPEVVELRDTIRERGVDVALVVRIDPYRDYGWLLIDGFHRYEAFMPLVLKEGKDLGVKIDYRGKMSDEAAYALSFALNLNRKDITPAQVGASCARLKAYQWSEAQIAKQLGKSVAWVRERIALSVAPMEVQNAVAAGTLPIDVGAKLSTAPAEKVRRVIDKSKEGRGSARRELTGVKRFSRAGIQAELDRVGQPKTAWAEGYNAGLLWVLGDDVKGK